MERRSRVAIVVLGDIGYNPRMQYHALSLVTQGQQFAVDIVTNGCSEPYRDVINHKNIHIHEMASVRLQGLSKISRTFALLIEATIQFFILLWFFCCKIPCPDAFLLQNPSSVSTLAAVKLCTWLFQCGYVIDWHNLGYTLLGMSHGTGHIKVKLYKWFEIYFGKTADGCLCVTEAMQHELEQMGVIASILYDKPTNFFRPATLKKSHELFGILNRSICEPADIPDCVSTGKKSSDPSNTLFSIQYGGNVLLKSTRPALVVSSTNWTSDEDFSLLLEAAAIYDRRVAFALNEDESIDEEKLWIDLNNGKKDLYPRLLFIITGEGPNRKKYEEQMKKLKLRRVAFRTMWLPQEYALLLGSADLGVSLYISSSGLDLPMKVVEMFGCGLPVCSASYPCIEEELLEVGENGLLFSSPSELAHQLMMIFQGFPDNLDALMGLKDGTLVTASSAWFAEWKTHALPVIMEAISRNAE